MRSFFSSLFGGASLYAAGIGIVIAVAALNPFGIWVTAAVVTGAIVVAATLGAVAGWQVYKHNKNNRDIPDKLEDDEKPKVVAVEKEKSSTRLPKKEPKPQTAAIPERPKKEVRLQSATHVASGNKVLNASGRKRADILQKTIKETIEERSGKKCSSDCVNLVISIIKKLKSKEGIKDIFEEMSTKDKNTLGIKSEAGLSGMIKSLEKAFDRNQTGEKRSLTKLNVLVYDKVINDAGIKKSASRQSR